jgi:hypothetical protein
MPEPTQVSIPVSIDLAAVARTVVAEILPKLQDAIAMSGDREIFTEAQGADFLAIRQHSLRDLRRAGLIQAYRVVRGRIRYRRQDLLAYLLRNPEPVKE